MIAMLTQYIDMIAKVIEFIGVMIMVLGLVFALYQTLRALGSFNQAVYVAIRQTVGKSILLGLEVLIAADIMATVVTEPTLRDVQVLAVIVLIRTFLSLSLQVELEGHFPWQKKRGPDDEHTAKPAPLPTTPTE